MCTQAVRRLLVVEGRPYSRLGELLDSISRKRRVRGPYRVARFVQDRTGGGPNGSHWSQVYYGERYPSPQAMERFCDAFELWEGEELDELARTYLREASSGPA